MNHLEVDPNENFENFENPAGEEAKKPEIIVPKVNLPAPVAKDRRGLQITERGEVALVTLEDQLAFAQRLISEGMISETFKTPQQVVVGMQYAKALRMNEMIALKMMYVVNGRPCLYSEGPLALCQREGLVSKIEEFFLDEQFNRISADNKNLNAKVYAAVTRVWRQGDDTMQEDFFTLDDLKVARLDQSRNGKKEVWAKWERIMMRYKARTMALRSKFADLIAGIPVAEYDHHFSPDLPDIEIEPGTAGPNRSSPLNEKFGKAEEKPLSASDSSDIEIGKGADNGKETAFINTKPGLIPDEEKQREAP